MDWKDLEKHQKTLAKFDSITKGMWNNFSPSQQEDLIGDYNRQWKKREVIRETPQQRKARHERGAYRRSKKFKRGMGIALRGGGVVRKD